MTPKRKSAPAPTKKAAKAQKGPTTPKELAQLHAKRRSMLDTINALPERGVDMEPKSFPFFDEAYKKRKWDKLFDTPAYYHQDMVTVGGSKVPFTKEVINDLFGFLNFR